MGSSSIYEGRFSSQAAAVFARAEKFRTKTLEPEAFTWEFVDRRANSAALREAARLGLTGIEVDRSVGGLGLGFREKVRIAEILCRSSMGFAFSLINSQNVAARIADMGTPQHQSDYLPGLLSGRRFGATALTEPKAGSDFAAISTTAARVSDGWLINGRKAWITNGAIADVVLCYVQTDDELGRDGIACFLIDGQRTGFESEPPYGLTAGSAIGVSGFALNNYEASNDDLLIEPGEGFRDALRGVNGARTYVAAMACAMVRSALAEAIEFGLTRETFGKMLIEHQGLGWSLADVANQLEAAEALTSFAVDAYDREGSAGDDSDAVSSQSVVLAASHAKKFAVEMLEQSLRTCMQAMGAEGLRSTNTVGRLLSEARIAGYVDGTTEMQTERIRRSLVDEYGYEGLGAASVAYRLVSVSDQPEDDDVQSDESAAETTDEIAEPSDDAESEAVSIPIPPVPATPPIPPMPPAGTQLVEASASSFPAASHAAVDLAAKEASPATSVDVDRLVPQMPPFPPVSATSAAPPLPGDEHKLEAPGTPLDAADEDGPATPPLPPDTLRRSDS